MLELSIGLGGAFPESIFDDMNDHKNQNPKAQPIRAPIAVQGSSGPAAAVPTEFTVGFGGLMTEGGGSPQYGQDAAFSLICLSHVLHAIRLKVISEWLVNYNDELQILLENINSVTNDLPGRALRKRRNRFPWCPTLQVLLDDVAFAVAVTGRDCNCWSSRDVAEVCDCEAAINGLFDCH